MEKIISVKNLRKAYKKSNRFDSETAVQNVCFELAPGNIMGLLGTNVPRYEQETGSLFRHLQLWRELYT